MPSILRCMAAAATFGAYGCSLVAGIDDRESGAATAGGGGAGGGSGECGDGGDTASWTPAMLGDALVLWLDPDGCIEIGTGVSRWADRSGKGNDALADDTARAPALLSAADSNTGHRALHFDGGDDLLYIGDDLTLQWGTGDFVVAVVARYSNAPPTGFHDDTYGTLYVKSSKSSPFPGPALWANTSYAFSGECAELAMNLTSIAGQLSGCEFVGTDDGGFNDLAWRVYGMRRQQNTVFVRVNGMVHGVDLLPSIDVSAPGESAEIGGRFSGKQLLHGDIAEVVAVKGAVDDDDVTQLEQYLLAKHGL